MAAMLPLMLLLSLLGLFQGQTVSASVGSTTELTCPSEPEGVTLEEIPEGISSGGLVLVDVRRPEELQDLGQIPGSHNIPLSIVASAFALPSKEFEATFGFPKPSPEQLVYTCRSGVRATTAWKQTTALGYCAARVYIGSFLEWSSRGQPIERVQTAS